MLWVTSQFNCDLEIIMEWLQVGFPTAHWCLTKLHHDAQFQPQLRTDDWMKVIWMHALPSWSILHPQQQLLINCSQLTTELNVIWIVGAWCRRDNSNSSLRTDNRMKQLQFPFYSYSILPRLKHVKIRCPHAIKWAFPWLCQPISFKTSFCNLFNCSQLRTDNRIKRFRFLE